MQKKATELAKSLGAESAATRGYDRAGGIDAFYFPSGNPDKLLWRAVGKDWQRFFYPKADKKNKALHDKIKALPILTTEEYNDIIGFKSQWVSLTHYSSYGIRNGKDCFLIEIPDECEYTPKEGMIEVLSSEFKSLLKDKS